jgi:hypothetical protein
MLLCSLGHFHLANNSRDECCIAPRSRGFVGYGDADPTNIPYLVHGAEMRVAETRVVNRTLRKAYGIGLCSVEELG